MFVSEEIKEVVEPPWPETPEGRSYAQLRADLDAFIEGRLITVADDPYLKDKKAFIARIDPARDEVWDIRTRDPRPAIRTAGSFAEFNVFVALVFEFRNQLDGPNGKLWRGFRERAKTEWRKRFHPYPPHRGDSLDAYLSNFHSV